jgi:outer membrane protein OmpU
MNNFKKIGISALAGSLAMTAAQATEFAVTGDAIVKYSTQDVPSSTEANNGKGLGVDTDLYFNASGEMDNGWTVAFFQAANTNTAWSNSSSQVTVGMGSLGTLQVNNVAGAKANGIDDVTPNAYNETWDGLALTTDNPSFFGSSTASGSIDYRIPAQEYEGTTINASVTYDPNADEAAAAAGGTSATTVTGTAYTLQMDHESGFGIGGGLEKIDNASGTRGTDEESWTAYATYAYGGISAGYQVAEQDTKNGGSDLSAEMMSIAYTTGDLSFSYGESTKTNAGAAGTADVDVELESLQVSYSMGAMTLAGALAETSNAGGTAGKKFEETQLSVSFAF